MATLVPHHKGGEIRRLKPALKTGQIVNNIFTMN
jgi:hypothetical protein